MKKSVVFFLLLVLGGVLGYSQGCPELLSPTRNAVNVPVDATITWQEIFGVPSYNISIGTTPGGRDIVNEAAVGTATSFTPPFGLPENTEVFVTITLFFFSNQENNVICPSIPFTTEAITTVPDCATLRSPANGETNVDIRSNLRWNFVPGATSYDVTVTNAAGDIIVATQNVVNSLGLDIPGLLPINEEIFVTIIPINAIGRAVGCFVESFTTGDVEVNLSCTTLISPRNGDSNVGLSPILEWEEVPGAEGYRVTIGTTPDGSDILLEGEFFRTSTLVLEFEPNRLIFVRITPFNVAGEAIGCPQESFSTAVGCGPFLNPATGEFVSLFPELEAFPSSFDICENSPPLQLSTSVLAESFRWSQITSGGSEIAVLSETNEVEISEAGIYLLEVTNFADPQGNNIPCTTGLEFRVNNIEGPTVNAINVNEMADGLTVTLDVTGPSVYEYALNNSDGPYQASNVFTNVPIGNSTFYIRDTDELNCIVSAVLEQDIIAEGFPNFFTPNGDGINDFWQFTQPPNTTPFNLSVIFIFNRFGQLILQIDPDSIGWNGTFNGRPLPSSDYWFRAISESNQEIRGHFALRR